MSLVLFPSARQLSRDVSADEGILCDKAALGNDKETHCTFFSLIFVQGLSFKTLFRKWDLF
jgi:hypothetical protein